MKRRKEKITYQYECTLTNEAFITTAKAPNPKELVSIRAYYELHPDKDDRPLIMKKKLGLDKPLPTNETPQE